MEKLAMSAIAVVFFVSGCTTSSLRNNLVRMAKANDLTYQEAIKKLGPKCVRLKKQCVKLGLSKCTLGDECLELGGKIVYVSKYIDIAIYTAWKALEISKDDIKTRKIITDIVKLLAELNRLIQQAHTLPNSGSI